MSRTEPEIRTVGDLFSDGSYVIPIYQRAYAWGEDQILTLLRDVADYQRKRAESYYIGSLVTHARWSPGEETLVYEVVDGQQRLTTIFIILAALTGRGPVLSDRLRYEGRDRSTTDLRVLAKRGPECSADELQESGIVEGLQTIKAAWQAREFGEDDLRYLLENVKVVRTTLPSATDLNHYFEVMNSRGEQLEKHEIVKASLMAHLTVLEDHERPTRAFARIWDACSDMSRHMIVGFDSLTRGRLFGADGSDLVPRSFDSLVEALGSGDSVESPPLTLDSIIGRQRPAGTQQPKSVADEDPDQPDRYRSIIDFPNFLLHVLALTVRGDARFSWEQPTTVPLDDKQLVTLFNERITSAEDVQRFAYNLVRVRSLFDRYVIKTDRSRASDDDSNWVLHRMHKVASGKLSPIATFAPTDTDDESVTTGEHEHAVMVQSMFQVTDSRFSYKNFLYATLEFLSDQNSPVQAGSLIRFFQDLAADRYAYSVGSVDLDRGTSTPHFAFNYLDYLLWRDLTDERSERRVPKSVAAKSYRFRYRPSVEHFYPRHPDPSGNIATLPRDEVDRFGNLCLMSRSENSKRSNLAPAAKVKQYRSELQSLKFQLMAATTDAEGWDTDQILAHQREMLDYLDDAMRSRRPD